MDEWKRSTKEGDVTTVMVRGLGDLAAGSGAPLLCLGHFAPPPEGLVGCNPPGAPRSVRNAGSCVFLQDNTLKCTVYRIRGSVSASNYIQLPKTSTQSLGLTGRYLYVLFRPLSTKHFIIHLDLSTKVQNSGVGAVHGGSAPLLPPLVFSWPFFVPAGRPGHPRIPF